MTSELKAAAEKRVREIAYATGWSGDMRVNMTTVVGALRCAVKMLDEERAARLAADEQREREDAEPITEEWLRSLGFSAAGRGILYMHVGHTGMSWSQLGMFYGTTAIDIKTRGQLRKLLEALKGSA